MKRKSRIDLGDVKEKKVQIANDDFLPLVSLTENPVVLVKSSENYRFGNYRKYYKLRHERKWNDPRLAVLDKDYFIQKKVLDIGCNDGTVSLIIALRYFPLRMQGIDIDYQMINKAIENMTDLEQAQKKLHIERAETKIQVEEPKPTKQDEILEKLSKLPKCFLMNLEEKAAEKLDNMYVVQNLEKISKQVELDKPIENQFPRNVFFRIENFISQYLRITEHYDTILCLSTTKWIHLNWGDDGIKRLFKKVYDSLYSGGHFILEPQDWKSYKKKRYFCPDFKKMYKLIKIRPEMFKSILVEQYNFKFVKEIKPDDVEAIQNGKNAFKRTIYIFRK